MTKQDRHWHEKRLYARNYAALATKGAGVTLDSATLTQLLREVCKRIGGIK